MKLKAKRDTDITCVGDRGLSGLMDARKGWEVELNPDDFEVVDDEPGWTTRLIQERDHKPFPKPEEPHNTYNGYCCACDIDIANMEDEIERRVEKKLTQLTR